MSNYHIQLQVDRRVI